MTIMMTEFKMPTIQAFAMQHTLCNKKTELQESLQLIDYNSGSTRSPNPLRIQLGLFIFLNRDCTGDYTSAFSVKQDKSCLIPEQPFASSD